MSILHVNQIAGALHRLFDGHIDLSDAPNGVEARERLFLSRALAAFVISQLAGIEPAHAADSVTDGTGDNGIDALHYDRHTKTMYIAQSKWHADGNGALDRSDVLKFMKGFDDLANLAFDRFNEKVRNKADTIRAAFHDDQARYRLIAAHTGTHDLDTLPRQDLDDTLDRYNETADPEAVELLQAQVLKQADIHGMVARGTQGDPINLEVALFQWGEATSPFAVYGQVAASDVARWWKDHYPQIVSQNIRMFLGTDTEVNQGLQATLATEPEHFWHFNNGITAICREVRRKLAGGSAKESGLFSCYDVRIVNGAQTAGSIAAAFEKRPESVDRARVQVRFISLGEGDTSRLGDAITKATNTQNRINRQDFVSLDPEQHRLWTELKIEGITYNYKSGEGAVRDQTTTDIEEATVALACASPELALSTQAKREIGKLWEDTSKGPYKVLFNPGVTGLKLWQCVRIMRLIDTALFNKRLNANGRAEGFLVHGNRYLAHKIFQELPAAVVNGTAHLPAMDTIAEELDRAFDALVSRANALYPGAYLAQLFKNQGKLATIARRS